MDEITLPIAIEDYSQDPNFMIYGKDMNRNPNTLQELSQIIYQKQLFLNTKKELFLKPKAEIGATKTPLFKKVKRFFLFHNHFPHIYFYRQFCWHFMANPMCNICNKEKENKSTCISNGLASEQSY